VIEAKLACSPTSGPIPVGPHSSNLIADKVRIA
jgi:hypothetical protein